MNAIIERGTSCLVALFMLACLLAGGCGVKGPPVAPEDLLPDVNDRSTDDQQVEDQESELY